MRNGAVARPAVVGPVRHQQYHSLVAAAVRCTRCSGTRRAVGLDRHPCSRRLVAPVLGRPSRGDIDAPHVRGRGDAGAQVCPELRGVRHAQVLADPLDLQPGSALIIDEPHDRVVGLDESDAVAPAPEPGDCLLYTSELPTSDLV